jgi:hypothetical protein
MRGTGFEKRVAVPVQVLKDCLKTEGLHSRSFGEDDATIPQLAVRGIAVVGIKDRRWVFPDMLRKP